MGFCRGTDIFDSVCDSLLSDTPKTKEECIIDLINALEDMDWDCQQDSRYFNHQVVYSAFRKLHPKWFDDKSD